MEQASNQNYMKGFFPYAAAAVVISLCGGFTASVPTAIATSWGIGTSVTFITVVYSLAQAAFAPIMGKLSGVLGRRKLLLIALGMFSLGELAIALCPDNQLALLLVFRFLVGAGAAGIAPVVMAYIMTEFPPEKIGFGFTIYMFMSCGVVIFGPTIGGLIMASASWRVVMWVCVVFCAIALAMCFAMVRDNPNIPRGTMDGFDWAGAIFVLITFGALTCVPTFGQNYSWSAVPTIVCIVIALAGVGVLVGVERKNTSPILSGAFMARKNFILPVLVLFLTQGLMTACLTNMIYFGYAIGKATIASVAMSIEYVGMALGTILLGPQADKKEPRTVAAVALALVALGVAIMLTIGENAGLLQMGGALFFVGLGLGGNVTVFMKVALSGCSPELAASGSGTFNVFKDMCSPFGVAIFVPMFTSGMAVKGPVGSMRSVAIVMLVCVAIGIGVCFLMPKVHAGKEVEA